VTLGERARLDHLYQASTWWMIAVTWPLYLLLLIFPSVFAGMFGSSYTAGATALAILSAAGLFNLATGNITVLLLMAGNSMLNMLNAAGSLTINIVLNLILIPRYGMSGAAVAWAASIVANNLAAAFQVNRLLHQHPFGSLYWLVTGGAIGCFGVVAVAGRLVAGETLHTLVAVMVVGSSLYVAFLWRIRERLELGALMASFGWRGGRLG
jgi:O-antigen/teichoic acid export membrane protein